MWTQNLLSLDEDVAAAVAEFLFRLSRLLLLLQGCDRLALAVQLPVVLGLVAVHEAEVPPLLAHHGPLVGLHQSRDRARLGVRHLAGAHSSPEVLI